MQLTKAEDGTFSISGTLDEIQKLRDVAEADWGADDDFIREVDSQLEGASGTITVQVPNDTIWDLGDLLESDGGDLAEFGQEIQEAVSEAQEPAES